LTMEFIPHFSDLQKTCPSRDMQLKFSNEFQFTWSWVLLKWQTLARILQWNLPVPQNVLYQ
jgi:hypothetical protein